MSFLNLSLILVLILLFLGALFEAPWVPTRKNDYERIVKLANLQPGMFFYDLGSGNGEMLFYLSRRYDINCIGIEISPILYLYSKIKSLFYKKVNILYGNFYKHDISKADVIYVFSMPKNLEKLKSGVIKKMNNNSKIVISCWPLQNYSPDQISKIDKGITYYLYKKSALLK
jgi:SAM-dependent methyltransferase